ncbi:MAG: hypothetical protein U0U67_11805 [Chitinophagales bacterium]
MNKLLRWNAEFAKNVWLEISTQRLIAMPAIILLIIVLIFMNISSTPDAYDTLKYVSVGGFVFLGMLWGIKSASNSILDEYNEKTWDWQKMSIIGAWKLTIGKLFGSTIYNWYGAFICLVIYLFACLQDGTLGQGIPNACLMILSMITLHGIIILMALQLIRKADGRVKVKSNRVFIIAFLLFSSISKVIFFGIFSAFSFTEISLKWYGIPFTSVTISLFSSVFYCAWVVAAVYRSMRAELQYSDKPTWWLLFILTNFLFQFGFFIGYDGMPLKICLLVSVCIYFTEMVFINYILALTEPKDVVNFRTLQNAWIQKKWDTFLQNAPLWVITLPISFLFGLFAVILLLFVGEKEVVDNIQSKFDFNLTGVSVAFLISIFGFIIRDLSVLLLFHFSATSKRANTAMFFYFFLVYFVLPMLFAGNDNLTAAFFPSAQASTILMVVFPLVEAGIAVWFLLKRWKELSNKVSV